MSRLSERRRGALALSAMLMAGCLPAPAADNASQTNTGNAAASVTDKSAADTAALAWPKDRLPAPVAQPPATPEAALTAAPPKVIWKKGQSLEFGAGSDDLVPTDDVELAKKQAAAYPTSPEASFILAVALTRTSRVEEALQEVRRARKLAEPLGGPQYFDKMIASYEEMLTNFPEENRVRYGLAWAYYMKAYLVGRYARNIAKAKAMAAGAQPPPKAASIAETAQALQAGKLPANPPHLEGALEGADPAFLPEIKKYYEAAVGKLDELLVRKPDDIWSKVYRAFLKSEYTGNFDEAMATWKECQAQAPDNPAPYFFLGEAYLKQGNLKECLNNISKAIALRATGK